MRHLVKESGLTFQSRNQRTSLPHSWGSGKLVVVPFRPSDENEHVCSPSTSSNYPPAALHGSHGSRESVGSSSPRTGCRQTVGPLASAKSSTHPTYRPGSFFSLWKVDAHSSLESALTSHHSHWEHRFCSSWGARLRTGSSRFNLWRNQRDLGRQVCLCVEGRAHVCSACSALAPSTPPGTVCFQSPVSIMGQLKGDGF